VAELRLSDDLALPVELVTTTKAILAQKRKGKSYLAQVEAEEMLQAGQQVVALDPTGAWWGLRAGADGVSPGYPIIVIGGDHGDLPLDPGAGEALATAVATDHFSAVIDTSELSTGAQTEFFADFLATLYRLNRTAMHLYVDEADIVAPQKPFGNEARALGAAQNVVRRGGIRGIGCTLITQRPQVLNKDVLSQVDMLAVLRMTHPRDIAAIEDWIAVHADRDQAKELLRSLPTLAIGEAWFWNPSIELMRRISVRAKRTFDSGRTPKPGELVAAPKVLAPVDIARLGRTIAASVEVAQQSDPKALRAEVARLKAELADERARPPAIAPAYLDEDLGELRAELEGAAEAVQLRASRMLSVIPVPAVRPPPVAAPAPAPTSPPRAKRPGDASLSGGQRRILTALAQCPIGLTKRRLAALTEYSASGGGFLNNVSSLSALGHLERHGDLLIITAAGQRAAGDVEPLPTGRALLDYWLRDSRLGKAHREILRVLADEAQPRPKEYIATKAGYAADGGGFLNALSFLRTLELIEGKAKIGLAQALRGGGRG
jgi:hypothetical protein